jgi:MazG family protein
LEQDAKSLRPYVIEEAFEVVEAIEGGDPRALTEELGDLLLQIVFHAQIMEEDGQGDFDAVADGVAQKMIRRHPHVFSDTSVEDSGEVARNWEQIKALEKKGKTDSGALSGVPTALPALLRASRVGEKAAMVGFDWARPEQVEEKVHEEWAELKEAVAEQDKAHIEHEFGDLLFALCSLARHLGIDAESSLQSTVRRFKGRFEHMERSTAGKGTCLSDLSPEELDDLWNQAKKATQKQAVQT